MTTIEWTDKTWNPLRGCSHVSEGCTNCYAATMAHRFSGEGKPYEGLTRMTPHGARWTGEVRLVPDMLDAPLRWREPRMVFVNSMSDLFHEAVPFDYIDQVFAVMAAAKHHIFQVLTKRPERLLEYVRWQTDMTGEGYLNEGNVWLGVSVENQQTADERIPWLLQVPATVRFLSMEPLLGPVELGQWMPPVRPQRHRNSNYLCPKCGYVGDGKHWSVPTGEGDYDVICPNCGATEYDIDAVECGTIDWIIAGGESGPKARPMHPDWVRSIRDQCVAAGVPFFFKQWGEWVTEDQSPTGITLPGRSKSPWAERDDDGHYTAGDQTAVYKVGKSKSGALLDGREWREWPGAYRKGATA